MATRFIHFTNSIFENLDHQLAQIYQKNPLAKSFDGCSGFFLNCLQNPVGYNQLGMIESECCSVLKKSYSGSDVPFVSISMKITDFILDYAEYTDSLIQPFLEFYESRWKNFENLKVHYFDLESSTNQILFVLVPFFKNNWPLQRHSSNSDNALFWQPPPFSLN